MDIYYTRQGRNEGAKDDRENTIARFWQTDYDPSTRRWSHTYSLPAAGGKPRTIQFQHLP